MPIAPVGAIDTGRDPSNSFATAFIALRISTPRSVFAWPSSLPIDHMKTLGRLRSRRTRSPNWLRPSGFEDIMRVSSKTSMPSSSQASSSSGVGGLCDVRMRVAAHLLQLADAVILHRIRQRGAYAGVVLVIARPLQLHGLAVQEEALLRIKCNRANAKSRLVADPRSRRRSRPQSPAGRGSVLQATTAPAA